MDDKERTREFWIERASSSAGIEAVHPRSRSSRYDAWSRRMLQDWTLGRIRSLRPRFRRCLDLGCGYGDWTVQFAALADEIFACDVAQAFVDETRRRIPHASVACADLRGYPMPRDLDLVYFGAVLTYLDDRDAHDVLRRAREALAPGAVVLVRDWCTFNLGRTTTNPDPRYFSVHRKPRELCALAEAAGFACVDVRSSPSIYGEMMGRRLPGLVWPARVLWRLATVTWTRASHTVILRAI